MHRQLKAATMQWLKELVIKHGLCPWAAAAVPNIRIHVVDGGPEDLTSNVEVVQAEAQALQRSSGGLDEPPQDNMMPEPAKHGVLSTTLLVFGHREYDGPEGLGAFQNLWQEVDTALQPLRSTEGSIKLLAFHPWREDRGPGCRRSPLDEGHYGARAPFPVIQLLRSSDLEVARRSWAERHGGPGALGLLLRNKARLRALGRNVLTALMETFRRG